MRRKTDTEIKARVLAAVKQDPGSNVVTIANQARISQSTARRYLLMLMGDRVVIRAEKGRFYPL